MGCGGSKGLQVAEGTAPPQKAPDSSTKAKGATAKHKKDGTSDGGTTAAATATAPDAAESTKSPAPTAFEIKMSERPPSGKVPKRLLEVG